MFAICHTKDFIKCVDELIKEMEEDKQDNYVGGTQKRISFFIKNIVEYQID